VDNKEDNMSEQIEEAVVIAAPKKRRGRPPKSALAEVKNRSVGRPKGTASIINEYRDRMLASPKSAKVLEKVFEVALNDGHPGQIAAMKLVMDRIVPASSFDTAKSSGGVPSISINISSVGAPTIERLRDVSDDGDEVVDV
jgi:hypothetical protein